MGPDLGDFRDYGDARDWTSVSLGEGYPGDVESATWLPKRVAQFRPTGICDDLPDGGVAQATRYDPYDANDEQRFQIALVLKTIRDWVGGCSGYRPLRLLTAGVARTGKSFVVQVLTDLVRGLLGFQGAAMVYAPTWGRGVPGGWVNGPQSPPTTHWEEGSLPSRAAEGRIAAKSAGKFKSTRPAFRGRTRDGRARYARVAGVQCIHRSNLARRPSFRIAGRKASRKFDRRRPPTSARPRRSVPRQTRARAGGKSRALLTRRI